MTNRNGETKKSQMRIQRSSPVIKSIIQRNTQLLFIWIPAHSGIHENEKADELAKQATSQLMHSYSPEIIIFYNSAKVYTKALWNNGEKGKYCFSIIPKVTNNPWYHQTLIMMAKLISTR